MVPERSMAMAAGVLFNVTGRGSPDILLFGSNLWCVGSGLGLGLGTAGYYIAPSGQQAADPLNVQGSLRRYGQILLMHVALTFMISAECR